MADGSDEGDGTDDTEDSDDAEDSDDNDGSQSSGEPINLLQEKLRRTVPRKRKEMIESPKDVYKRLKNHEKFIEYYSGFDTRNLKQLRVWQLHTIGKITADNISS